MIRLAIRVAREHAELVLAELLELAPSGVEEVDAGDAVEYAVYGPPGELPALPDLKAAAGGALVSVSTTEVADDWSERWREFHRPLVLGDALTVRPPWEPPASTALDIVIDPAQAFGTGAHATTRLCLELMLSLSGRPRLPERGEPAEHGSFLDLGCGSGVLAIVAGALGYAPVVALDFDRAAVAATEANARVNGIALEARQFDLRAEAVPEASLIAANLVAPLLLSWAASQRGPWPEKLIASGILATEADRVADAFAAAGMRERRRAARAEWVALLLEPRRLG